MKVQVLLSDENKIIKLHAFGWVKDKVFVSRIKTKFSYKIFSVESGKWEK